MYKPQITPPMLDLGDYGHSLTADYNRRKKYHLKKQPCDGIMTGLFWFLVIGSVICLMAG